MAIKLFIGNLDYGVGEDELKEMFTSYGEVSSAFVIKDKMSGRSKGFGFVEMDDEAGQTAIKELNGKEVNGRPLVVNEARPQEDRPRRDFRDNRGGNGGGRDNFRRQY